MTVTHTDDRNPPVEVESFAAGGSVVSTVPVNISYGIIERFSEGLYSSPTKTFEELITNSYDAGAKHVWVYLPADFTADGAALLVVDDGESMGLEGLTSLWRIGESQKRATPPPAGRRKPVGKFGIGKLATYVLAQKLTYLVHQDEKYHAVTMDYGRVSPSAELMDGVNLALQVVELERSAAFDALRLALRSTSISSDAKVIESIESSDHWTAAVLSDLKPTAHQIRIGRLRWVLRTALPLNPEFRLAFNDEDIQSSKVDSEELWHFTVGSDEGTLPKPTDSPWGPGTASEVEVHDDGRVAKHPAVKLPQAGLLWGRATLYREPLERGRSQDLGRSHGFFVRVRGRLINLDDEDFSIGPELRHGTLTRFRMEINADDLDGQVASARESLKESPGLQELKNYLLAIFNKARAVSVERDDDDVIRTLAKDGRLAQPATALSQGPLRRMLQRAASGEAMLADALRLDDEGIERTKAILSEGGDVIQSVLMEEIAWDAPLAAYDPARRSVVLNQSHPFVMNYIGVKSSAEPLKLLGLSELLTQAYLLDENVSPEIIKRVMHRRDTFLRELTYRFPRSAPIIARRLRDSSNDEDALEDAVSDALELLGFAVERLGGRQAGPDGIATARLGWRGDRSESYAFTYDAKSTKDAVRTVLRDGVSATVSEAGRIRADTARTSILRVHRERAAMAEVEIPPTFTLLVAPDFQGALESDGLINDVCRNDGITALRIEDLARLVELFTLQGLNPHDLRSLFNTSTPEETRGWVDRQLLEAKVPRPPVAVLVEILVENSERKFAIGVEALAAFLSQKGYDMSLTEIGALVRGLAALAPKSIYADSQYIALNATPGALYLEIRESLNQFDPELVGEYLNSVPE